MGRMDGKVVIVTGGTRLRDFAEERFWGKSR